MNIPFAFPDISDNEIEAVIRCLRSGWITSGKYMKEFEENFQDYVGSKYALAVSSATAGLHLALDALKVSRGDYVITSTYTFTATVETITYLGAIPLLCDIDPVTRNLDVACFESLCEKFIIEKRCSVKGVIPVHFAGFPCDMDAIIEIAEKYNLFILEDAAHALSSIYKKRMIGNIGDITVFSFYANKNITTAEGGMVTTNSEDNFNQMKTMRLHGISTLVWDRYKSSSTSFLYDVVAAGYKYNMPDILAVMGIEQLKRLSYFKERKQQIIEMYQKGLSSVEAEIELPHVPLKDIKQHSLHLYCILLKNCDRMEFMIKMKEKGIQCSVHFKPLHLMTYWKKTLGYKSSDFPVATDIFNRTVSLPLFSKMTDDEAQYVISSIVSSLRECSVSRSSKK